MNFVTPTEIDAEREKLVEQSNNQKLKYSSTKR